MTPFYEARHIVRISKNAYAPATKLLFGLTYEQTQYVHAHCRTRQLFFVSPHPVDGHAQPLHCRSGRARPARGEPVRTRRRRFRPDAAGAGAVADESFAADIPDTQEGSDGSLNENEVTVFDTAHPAVARLNAALLEALQAAANEAAAEDITLYVNSGWRSPRLQERLLEEAVAEYGSREEALRWVATPERSAHVSGDAVDIGPFDASYWLSYNGAQYGICQIYANEGWHFELRPDAVERGCPELYTDPTEDPRMR